MSSCLTANYVGYDGTSTWTVEVHPELCPGASSPGEYLHVTNGPFPSAHQSDSPWSGGLDMNFASSGGCDPNCYTLGNTYAFTVTDGSGDVGTVHVTVNGDGSGSTDNPYVAPPATTVSPYTTVGTQLVSYVSDNALPLVAAVMLVALGLALLVKYVRKGVSSA